MAPSDPTLTEKNLPDQTGKVYIVTGGSSGIGKELVKILYGKNAKIYLATRSAAKTTAVINNIKEIHPQSTGGLIHLPLDLNDLTTIKSSAQEFLSKEKVLHVLWNNAGVMIPPQGSKTKQGYELQLGTNNVAPFLFTKLLTPMLVETAKVSPPSTVRVVWVSSGAVERFSPNGGIEMDNLDYSQDKSAWFKYGTSKAGNVYHATEFARRYSSSGILSISLDPGNLKTDLYQHMPKWQSWIAGFVLKEPIYGAYTELFAGLSPDITLKNNGAFVQPWGKIGVLRKDVLEGTKGKSEGGTSVANDFWDWTEQQIQKYS